MNPVVLPVLTVQVADPVRGEPKLPVIPGIAEDIVTSAGELMEISDDTAWVTVIGSLALAAPTATGSR